MEEPWCSTLPRSRILRMRNYMFRSGRRIADKICWSGTAGSLCLCTPAAARNLLTMLLRSVFQTPLSGWLPAPALKSWGDGSEHPQSAS
eukprot:8973272-Pyramimonas_sp.AAC.1